MARRPNESRKFVAVDEDGKRYHIIEYPEMADPHHAGAIEQREAGRKSLRTTDGISVRRIARGIYDVEHAFGPIRVTSDDPDAP